MSDLNPQDQPVCVILGAGPGNGAAIARKFTLKGYRVALIARNKENLTALAIDISGCSAFTCDITDQTAVQKTFKEIATKLGEVTVLVLNAGKAVWGDPLSIELEVFENAWKLNTFGPLVAIKEILPAMLEKSAGNIVFIGATASLRGGPTTTAFASAKASQHSLAQSLARCYGPKGIHVSIIIVDAVVNEPVMRGKFNEKPDSFFLQPDDLAETAFTITHQSRSAWTFQIDLRPHAESW